jgi:hypothetical protein
MRYLPGMDRKVGNVSTLGYRLTLAFFALSIVAFAGFLCYLTLTGGSIFPG